MAETAGPGYHYGNAFAGRTLNPQQVNGPSYSTHPVDQAMAKLDKARSWKAKVKGTAINVHPDFAEPFVPGEGQPHGK